MSKYYLMSLDTAKTFFQGALGAMTFGMYHQYTSNQIMENNNKTIKLTHEHAMKELEERLEKQHRIEIDELKKEFQLQIQQIQSRRWF